MGEDLSKKAVDELIDFCYGEYMDCYGIQNNVAVVTLGVEPWGRDELFENIWLVESKVKELEGRYGLKGHKVGNLTYEPLNPLQQVTWKDHTNKNTIGVSRYVVTFYQA